MLCLLFGGLFYRQWRLQKSFSARRSCRKDEEELQFPQQTGPSAPCLAQLDETRSVVASFGDSCLQGKSLVSTKHTTTTSETTGLNNTEATTDGTTTECETTLSVAEVPRSSISRQSRRRPRNSKAHSPPRGDKDEAVTFA